MYPRDGEGVGGAPGCPADLEVRGCVVEDRDRLACPHGLAGMAAMVRFSTM
jgi:hypothetical protein